MFVLKKSPVVSWPITIPMPANDGKVNQIPVTVKYKLLPQARYDELKAHDNDLLNECVVGWNDDAFGHENANGEADPLPFTAENLAALIEYPFIRTGFLQGYWKAVAGLEKN
jgi:hypothetical protein